MDERVREKLRHDTPFYCRHVVKIVDKAGNLVPLEVRPSQLKLEAALRAQREAGQPERAVVLKSRKTGISTYVQAKMIQRATQTRFRKGMVVAQDGDTASELFGIGEVIYAELPGDPELGLKPTIRNRRHQSALLFGEPSRAARDAGQLGLHSSLTTSTATEVEAGRGFTFHDLHLSEVGTWPSIKKLTALLNAVPDEPNTMIVLESTANGENHFFDFWNAAVAGENGYAPVFISWLEDPDCSRPFMDAADRAEFEAMVGTGPYGADEPQLLEAGATLEQLNWRRWAIGAKCNGSLDIFHQEYPSYPEEAFLGSGRTVFDAPLILAVRKAAADAPAPVQGIVKETRMVTRKGRVGNVEIPTDPVWVPREATGFGVRHPFWDVWEMPAEQHLPDLEDDEYRPAGAYILTVDPMGGEETEDGQLAFHGITIIDHRTLRQVAEYQSRIDAHLIAREALLMAELYNRALIVVEVTGGYGMHIVKTLHFDYRYPRIYMRQREDDKKLSQLDRLGWSTDRATKPMLEDGARELFREGTHGVRSRRLAGQVGTYRRDEKGRTGPAPNRFADVLMSWMIGQQVARENLPPIARDPRKQRTTATRPVANPRGGY